MNYPSLLRPDPVTVVISESFHAYNIFLIFRDFSTFITKRITCDFLPLSSTPCRTEGGI